jgi:type IV pilus assembly protein PilN
MSAPVLDLLRQRREELGLEPLSGALAERRSLVRRGVLIGGSLLAAVGLATALVLLQRQFLKAQMGPLLQYEAQAADLRTRLESRKAKVDGIAATNRKLVDALTNVRTSSALLSDLQLRTPEGVQLRSAAARDSGLVVKGQAREPKAFSRINALQLELQGSPLLEAGGVNLTKVERVPEKGSNAPAGAITGPDPVAFDMGGPFATLAPARQLDLLQSLGSNGMARRLQLLQREGLLP